MVQPQRAYAVRPYTQCGLYHKKTSKGKLKEQREQLVLRDAEVLTRENRVTDALYGELAARFPRAELLELCFTVALTALVNPCMRRFAPVSMMPLAQRSVMLPTARSADNLLAASP